MRGTTNSTENLPLDWHSTYWAPADISVGDKNAGFTPCKILQNHAIASKKLFNGNNCMFVASEPRAIGALKYADVGPSVALIGRSNVGKSTLINELLRVKYCTFASCVFYCQNSRKPSNLCMETVS